MTANNAFGMQNEGVTPWFPLMSFAALRFLTPRVQSHERLAEPALDDLQLTAGAERVFHRRPLTAIDDAA